MKARREPRQHHPRLALESFRPSINQWNDTGEVVLTTRPFLPPALLPALVCFGQGEEGAVQPNSGLDIVEASDDDGKLLGEGRREGGKEGGREGGREGGSG